MPLILGVNGLTEPTIPRDRQSAAEFAQIYKERNLEGGHVIKLGPGNDEAALQALSAWPGKTDAYTVDAIVDDLRKFRQTPGWRWHQQQECQILDRRWS